ncbi:ATP-binding protein [Paenibacillus sp. Leaf72]|uniref:ATP-binding protein n=1 Tax=Paenibacillus sp. Leaf72 TaxID=1736234 RepID=UPI0006FC9ECE|nr:ATP-binding protein [Paenibacillus sp. Leaf72]KQO18067.1 hypothetical protein ASF12_05345 [Paenibacillus sp. Leaf72]
MIKNSVDITPTPRVLRVLGEIPFQPWQCFGEFIDNSLDAYMEMERLGLGEGDNRISIRWSSEAVGEQNRTIEIVDNAMGMSIDQLTKAVKAGYSSNNPTSNLGLFGIGFNIATARLGEKTTIYSTRKGETEWLGVEIDFNDLIKKGSFSAPVVSKSKDSPEEQGTLIVVSALKEGVYSNLKHTEKQIRRIIENVYAPLMGKKNIAIFIQGIRLSPKKYCMWSASRFVMRGGNKVEAVQKVDRILGTALFDVDKNRYLSSEQEADFRYKVTSGENLPPNIIERQKRLKGWIGIQCYFDTNDFGIDFIRNGRKILISSKVLFTYDNPLTGTSTLEYPIELGSTVGGRIVGELEVDYLIPTYQKNDFDRTDISWQQTVEALRGIGPILPKQRKAMGFEGDNTSPVGLLATAYRRTEKGTKNLAVDRETAREFLMRFLKNDPDFLDDTKWWQAVVEADRTNATLGGDTGPEADTGERPSDDPFQYLNVAHPENKDVIPPRPPGIFTTVKNEEESSSSTCDELLLRSRESVTLSGSYTYDSKPSFKVRAREVTKGEIKINGLVAPCAFFSEGVECDFFYDEKHTFLSQYPNTPKSLLLIYLAHKFMVREGENDLLTIYSQLSIEKMKEARIDKISLKERAEELFQILREKMIDGLAHRYSDVIACVQESPGETEDTVQAMLSNGDLISAFNLKTSDGIDALEFVPVKTLIRVISQFPEELFDGKVFKAMYNNLACASLDQKAYDRLKDGARERIISFLKDAAVILGERSGSLSKNELYRYSLSVEFLMGEIVS